MGLPNDVATVTTSGTGGFKAADAAQLMIDKMHIYNDVLDSALPTTAEPRFFSSYGPYFRNCVRKAKHSQKYTSFLLNNTNGVITTSNGAF